MFFVGYLSGSRMSFAVCLAMGIFVSRRWISRLQADKHPAFAIHWLYWHLPASPMTARCAPRHRTSAAWSAEPEKAMDFETAQRRHQGEMQRRNRGLGLAVGVLAAGQILALVVILNLLGTVRTVVVPPSINKTFWVTRDQASNEYLEQMGSFIAWLVLDVTPASIDWKKDILLGYVEPDQYGPLKTRQEVEAERLKRINAATVFRAPATGAQRRRPERRHPRPPAHPGQRLRDRQRPQGLPRSSSATPARACI